jgi:hypothetical protein
MTIVMWSWDAYDKSFQPQLGYDSPDVNYFVDWVILFFAAALYGLVIGQALLWLGRRLKMPTLRFFLIANLLCGSLIGLALTWGASRDLADIGSYTLVDYGFAVLMTGGGCALWSLIFFGIRRPDRDAKDVSASAS